MQDEEQRHALHHGAVALESGAKRSDMPAQEEAQHGVAQGHSEEEAGPEFADVVGLLGMVVTCDQREGLVGRGCIPLPFGKGGFEASLRSRRVEEGGWRGGVKVWGGSGAAAEIGEGRREGFEGLEGADEGFKGFER